MKLPRRQFLHLAAGAAAIVALTNTTLAQDWPIRPVTMVYPFAAGSAADVLGRLFAMPDSTPAVQEKLKELGYVLVAPERRSTEYLGKFVESEVEKWAAVIKAANIKPE
jgi:tripartite-type tricarboxylate transporter receptor subunit TctC